jgi:hypothetical protein
MMGLGLIGDYLRPEPPIVGLDPGDITGLDVAPATIPVADRQIPARNVRISPRLFRVTLFSPKRDRSKNITRQ